MNRKYALTWEDALNVMKPRGDGPYWVCRLCGSVVYTKMVRLHILERHPVIPVEFELFKCAYCGDVEESANDLMGKCKHGDKCYLRQHRRRLSEAQNEVELLKAELRLKLRALKQALEEGDAEEAKRIAGRLLKEVGEG